MVEKAVASWDTRAGEKHFFQRRREPRVRFSAELTVCHSLISRGPVSNCRSQAGLGRFFSLTDDDFNLQHPTAFSHAQDPKCPNSASGGGGRGGR